jgi:predicted DNA-binding transcriptional regulator AlpA
MPPRNGAARPPRRERPITTGGIDYERLAKLIADNLREFSQAPEIMTVARCATYTGFSAKSLDQWRNSGDGPKFVKVSNRVRYRKTDIDAWIAAKTKANTLGVT